MLSQDNIFDSVVLLLLRLLLALSLVPMGNNSSG